MFSYIWPSIRKRPRRKLVAPARGGFRPPSIGSRLGPGPAVKAVVSIWARPPTWTRNSRLDDMNSRPLFQTGLSETSAPTMSASSVSCDSSALSSCSVSGSSGSGAGGMEISSGRSGATSPRPVGSGRSEATSRIGSKASVTTPAIVAAGSAARGELVAASASSKPANGSTLEADLVAERQNIEAAPSR